MSYQQILERAEAKRQAKVAEDERAEAAMIAEQKQKAEQRNASALATAAIVIPSELMPYLMVVPGTSIHRFLYNLNIPGCTEISFELYDGGILCGNFSTEDTPTLIEDDDEQVLWINETGKMGDEDLDLVIAQARITFQTYQEFKDLIDAHNAELEEKEREALKAFTEPTPVKPQPDPLPDYKVCLEAIKAGDYTKAIAVALYELAYHTEFYNS